MERKKVWFLPQYSFSMSEVALFVCSNSINTSLDEHEVGCFGVKYANQPQDNSKRPYEDGT